MPEKILKLKTSELPVLLELEATNGQINYLEIMPSKSGFGAFINRVSNPLRHYISRGK